MRQNSSVRRVGPGFRSSIPAQARPRVRERHPSGEPARVEYLVGRAVVGSRHFDQSGGLVLDCGVRHGKRHGREYRWDIPRKLLSATTYKHGLEHGLARQWSADGRLIGSYRMRNGTGIDMWWQETWTKPRRTYLAEVRFTRKGQRHGFEWWLNDDQRSVYLERYWALNQPHGIEREWNDSGKLKSGYPRFYVRGRRVTRHAYERARTRDRSLPPYEPQDNRPHRSFPPAVVKRTSAAALRAARRR